MRSSAALAILALGLASGAGAEWPQFGGPERDFTSPSTGLASSWPASGPRLLWERPLGEGYSGIAVADGRAYTLYRAGTEEVVIAFDPLSGETLWEHRWEEPSGRLNRQYGPGPHTTPLVVGSTVYAIGSLGRLVALNAADGALRWAKELIDDLGGTLMDRGYSSSPLAFRDRLLVQVGGRGRALASLRQSDGEVLWTSGSYANSPASPLLIDVAGRPQVVTFMASDIVGFDAVDGRELWKQHHPVSYDLNISMPLWGDDGVLFVSSAYNAGSTALALTREGAEKLWYTNQMRVQFTNAVRLGDFVLGSSGDFGPVPLTALDLASGAVLWRDRSFARASIVDVDGKLLLLDEDGTLGLARATRAGLEVLAEHQVADRRSWTAPTLHGRVVLIRDREELRALELPAAR